MINISIISNCNNNCDYCFQKDSYHNLNKILEYDEILEIFKWAKGEKYIGILGGEPTLHPQCVDICRKSAEEYTTIFFTNLLCNGLVLENLAKIGSLHWLINSTTRKDSVELFEENISYLNNLKNFKPATIGITLVGDVEVDAKYIENLVRLARKYPNVTGVYRIALATPCHDKEFKLKRYDKSIELMYSISKKETPNKRIFFDCSVNNCLISSKLKEKLMQDNRTYKLDFVCHPTERVDIMADRSINFCSSVPDEIFKIRDYRNFENWRECSKYILDVRNEFMKKYSHFCKVSKYCNDKSCKGACFASLVNLVKQEKKKNICLQKLHLARYKISQL